MWMSGNQPFGVGISPTGSMLCHWILDRWHACSLVNIFGYARPHIYGIKNFYGCRDVRMRKIVESAKDLSTNTSGTNDRESFLDTWLHSKRELNNIGVFCNCRAEWGKRSLWSSTSFSWNTVTASKSRVDTSVVAWISSRDCGSRKKAEVCKSVVLVSCRQSKYVVNYERLQKCLNDPDQTCWNEIELKKRSGQ